MAAVLHGVPGEWARVRGTVLSLWPLFLCFALLGAFAAAALSGRYPAVFGVAWLASLAAVAVAWRKGLRRVESFFKGARGEERVAGLLAGLPDGCHVFNDFAAGPHRVDHVIAGPWGVFSVETKNWAGEVTVADGHVLVNGRLPSRSPEVQAAGEADAVRAKLRAAGWEGAVTPVVCFASDRLTAEASVGGVALVNARALVAWMQAHPSALAPDELERLVRMMELRG